MNPIFWLTTALALSTTVLSKRLINEKCQFITDDYTWSDIEENFHMTLLYNSNDLRSVYYCIHQRFSHCKFAAKRVNLTNEASYPVHMLHHGLINEVNMMESTQSSPYFPTIYSYTTSNLYKPGEKYGVIVMEYIPGISLYTLARCFDMKIPNDVVRFISSEVAYAIQFLHFKKIVHLDIKPENIMIDAEGHVKIIDFGLSLRLTCLTDDMFGNGGSLFQNAPEVRTKNFDYTIDWYAYGASLYFLSNEYETPFCDITDPKLNNEIEFDQVIISCTKRNPKERIKNIQMLQELPYFKDINWKDVKERVGVPPESLISLAIKNSKSIEQRLKDKIESNHQAE